MGDRDRDGSARKSAHPPIPPIRVLAAALDLSPQGLRDRLLRGPTGAPLHFDAAPPDLAEVDKETLLKELACWRNGLETCWAEDDAAPPAQIARNSKALLDELRGQVRRELDGLLQNDPRGYQALDFLDELLQELPRARAQLAADDGPFLKEAIPSADQSFQKLGSHIMQKRYSWQANLVSASAFYFPLLFFFWIKHATLSVVFGLWTGSVLRILVFEPRDYQRKLVKRQADFISAVQLKFESLQERQMRARRRDVLNELAQALQQERQALLNQGK